MNNLQDLFEFYKTTQPSDGKIKAATAFLIHTCKAMKADRPEDIESDLFVEIPQALETCYSASPTRVTQDKCILAEMIGRYGPLGAWQEVVNVLLDDEDENVRQFSLHALAYCARSDIELVLPFIERYRLSGDTFMKNVTANLVSKLLCSGGAERLKERMGVWAGQGDMDFIREIAKNMDINIRRSEKIENGNSCMAARQWIEKEFDLGTK